MATIQTKIRPSSRILSTIGEDLIGDVYASIAELVKNSYDADANKVDIIFDYSSSPNINTLKIEITDDGHGMSTSVVMEAWLVPATKDKINRIKSPKGRLFQGKKGIGRYAAALLGQELLLKTTDVLGEQTEIFINWTEFQEKEFLDDVEILVDTKITDFPCGTSLFIVATGTKYSQWTRYELGRLSTELRKLKSPINVAKNEYFKINLAFINCPFEEYNNQIFEIDTFPIIDFYDYRISGNLDALGNLTALFENHSEQVHPIDRITKTIKLANSSYYCGPIAFDFRVFDRDPKAISNLINKGLIDPISGLAIGKLEAKQLLDEVYGVNLYRGEFRIRPYGNGGIDWLNLDKDRIQNPSLRISNNQIVGFVQISPENISHLEEKSARDGLKENDYYYSLIFLLRNILSELETRRYNHRQKLGKEKNSKNISTEIESLFDYSLLAEEVSNKLSHFKIDPKTTSEIASIIYRDAERKSKLLQNIQNTIAIYQGQATLGKIVTVLLHEGRKPVQYFKQQSPNLVRWLTHYKAKRDWNDDIYLDIMDRLTTFKEQSELLAGLFRRLDPLAKQNRGEKRNFFVKEAINKAVRIFAHQFEENQIGCQLLCDDSITLLGWEEDLIIALTNLIENSIYWLNQNLDKTKNISIDVRRDNDIIIHYKDTGPGIDKTIIESGLIFEPGFSKKIDGTGLGLPIAGEAIERLNGSIMAHYSDNGAYFTIEIR